MLQKLSALFLITGLTAWLWVGCAYRQPTPPNGEPTPDPVTSHLPGQQVSEMPSGPEEKDGYLHLEGVEEPFRFHRLHIPDLGLVTYIPHDLIAGPVTSQQGDEIMIWAAFGGEKHEDTYLSLRLYAEGISQEQAITERLEQLEQAGYSYQELDQSGDDDPHSWALAAYSFQGTEDGVDYSGTLALGNRGDRTLVVEIRTPVEKEDGFYPRCQAVLDTMEWYEN